MMLLNRLPTALVLAVAVALSSLPRGPAADVSPTAGSTSLKVGTLLPLTGPLAFFGPPLHNAALLAAQDINDAGGVLSAPIEIVQGDSGTSCEVAVPEALSLIQTEGVSAIVGAAASGVTICVAEDATIPNGVLQISPASTSPQLSTLPDQDFLFRTVLSDAAQAAILAQLAWDAGWGSASAIYIDNAYGQGLSDLFRQAFPALGGQVLATVPIAPDDTDCEDEIGPAIDGAPDVLLVLTYPTEAIDCLNRAIANGVGTFLFVDGTRSQDIIDAVGAEHLNGMCGTATGTVDSAAGTAFDAAYNAEYGEAPVAFAREAYDAVILTALAAEAAQSTDPSAVRDALRGVSRPGGEVVGLADGGIGHALDQVGLGVDVDYQGAAGSVDIDVFGDVTEGAIEVWCIESGAIVTDHYEPVDLDQDGDWVPTPFDNCPSAPNPGQDNSDSGPFPSGTGAIGNGKGIPGNDATVPNGDALGDACDHDLDNDGIPNASDPDPGGDITYDDDNDGNPASGCLGGTDTDPGEDGPSWDTDCDGKLDGWVGACGSTSTDTDTDGLMEAWENCKWGTNPGALDSDGDGMNDCKEAVDVDGNAQVKFTSDVLYYARAAVLPAALFGKDGDFDIDGNGVVKFTTDVIYAARFAVLPGACKDLP